MSRTGLILFSAAISTAAFHTLFPDHWLPFVLVSRAQKWSLRKTLWITGLSSFLHVASSLILGMIALLVGLELSQATGEIMEQVTSVLLIVFGSGYAFWSWRRGSEHGPRLKKYLGDGVSGYLLAVILGLNPCVVALPIFFACSTLELLSATLIMGSFALVTIGTMLMVTALALTGLYEVEMPFLERYGDLISGLAIAIVGIAVVSLDLLS